MRSLGKVKISFAICFPAWNGEHSLIPFWVSCRAVNSNSETIFLYTTDDIVHFLFQILDIIRIKFVYRACGTIIKGERVISQQRNEDIFMGIEHNC